jgi:hypothetical protein
MKRSKTILWLLFLIELILLFSHSIDRQETLGLDYPIFYEASLNHGRARGYIYPPLLAWIIYPLASLPYRLSSGIWYVLQGIIVLFLTWKCLPDSKWNEKTKLTISMFFVMAVIRLVRLNVELGQVNCLLLFLILIGIQTSQVAVSGFSLGLATAIKLFPAIFFPYALRFHREKWKTFVPFYFGTIVVGWTLPCLFGYDFSGINNLMNVISTADNMGGNLSLYEFIGPFAYFVLLALLVISLVVTSRVRNRPEVWSIPVILTMLIPTLLMKAHLVNGLLLGPLLRVFPQRLFWVPFVWALGTLGTIIWPASSILGNLGAFIILLYELWQRRDTT